MIPAFQPAALSDPAVVDGVNRALLLVEPGRRRWAVHGRGRKIDSIEPVAVEHSRPYGTSTLLVISSLRGC